MLVGPRVKKEKEKATDVVQAHKIATLRKFAQLERNKAYEECAQIAETFGAEVIARECRAMVVEVG